MQNMEQLVKELCRVMPFKADTAPGDLVLVAALNPQMLVYGLVTDIARDNGRRDEWWQLSLHLLTVPPQQVTWTLRSPQFTGQEIFTMGGNARFIQAVTLPGPPLAPLPAGPPPPAGQRSGLRLVKG